MQPHQPLSEAEMEELDAFLLSEQTPEEGMDISTLDGFFAAIVLNPHPILPSRWLPWMWDTEKGEDAPEFSNLEQANRIVGYIMRHYNAVLTAIDNARFEPLLLALQQKDGSEFLDAEGWSAGFMLGMSLFPDPWGEVLDQHGALIAPIVLLGTEEGWKFLEESSDPRNATREAYEAIPDIVAALHAHFEPQRERARSAFPAAASATGTHVASPELPVRRGEGKVGRNDPCPCGSGRKFKKCCGAEGKLH